MRHWKPFACWVSIGTLCMAPCGAPEIGIAVTAGNFTVNHNRVSGNATVFDGTVIETSQAYSSVRLTSGSRVDLAAGSAGSIYHNKTLLTAGGVRADLVNRYAIE